MKSILFTSLLIVSIFACQTDKNQDSTVKTDEELKELARKLAHQYILSDGHVDLPYRLKEKNWIVDKGVIGTDGVKPVGDMDVLRSKLGGLDAPFMSIYIPSSYQKKN
jgi:membrane dipeptidase